MNFPSRPVVTRACCPPLVLATMRPGSGIGRAVWPFTGIVPTASTKVLLMVPDAPLLIRADLDPPLDRGELPWWMEQLWGWAGVLSWSGQGRPQDQMSVVAVQVDAPTDQLEAVARRLVAAVEEANAAYSDHYLPWRRERDAQLASEQHRQEQRRVKHQAVLDNY